MGTKNAAQLTEELGAKSKTLHDIFEEAGPTLDLSLVKSLEGDTAQRTEKVRQLNEELTALGKERDARWSLEGARTKTALLAADMNQPGRFRHAGDPGGHAESLKSFGEMFAKSRAFTEFRGRKGPSEILDIDLKSVFRTGAGWDPQDIRLPRVELDPQRPIAVVTQFPQLPTDQSAIVYMEETTFTNNAVETAESTATTASDLIGEAALALTQRTQPVEWLPVFIPVTQQQMEDVAGIGAYVNQRLQYALQARLDLQLLRGNGATPNLMGTNNVVGINTQAKGADPTPDAIYKGMDLVRTVGFAQPSVLFSHPNDWQAIRLLRTADGVYIWGSPADAGPERIWGVPVVQTTAALENTMTLGDYRQFAALYTKRGIEVEVSDSHAFYFTRGMLAVRASMRIAAVHFRPEAFCTITGV